MVLVRDVICTLARHTPRGKHREDVQSWRDDFTFVLYFEQCPALQRWSTKHSATNLKRFCYRQKQAAFGPKPTVAQIAANDLLQPTPSTLRSLVEH